MGYYVRVSTRGTAKSDTPSQALDCILTATMRVVTQVVRTVVTCVMGYAAMVPVRP